MCKFLITCLSYAVPIIPWCRKHQEWEGWNGLFGYVCSRCQETPEYKIAVADWMHSHP